MKNAGGRLRVRTNVAACVGHARCGAVAPDVYELNDAGYNDIPERIVPASLKDQAIRGARACPERVITVDEVD